MIWLKIWRMTAYPASKLSLESTLTIPLFKSGVATSRICLMPPTKWLSRRVATVDGSMIHGERALTSSTPSSTSSGLMHQRIKKRHPAPHIALMGLSLWAGNRTRKSRGWTNELYVLCALHSSRPAHLAHRFARPDLQGAGIVQNWSGPHNFWDSCLSSNGKM